MLGASFAEASTLTVTETDVEPAVFEEVRHFYRPFPES